ncbi:MAG: hypothetical protein ACI4OT_01215 [Bacilli bacterium]
MKKNNILKVVLITIAVIVLLTWLLPTATFSSELTIGDRAQMGLFDIFNYPTVALQYFFQILLYALVVGGFYGIVSKTGVYRKLLDKVVDGFKGKENIFIIIVSVIFALLASCVGMTYSLIFLFPFVIAVLLLMGYDKLLSATVTVGSIMVGIMGSLFSTDVTYYLQSYLGLGISDEIVTKIIILVIGLVLLLFNALSYAKKNKVKKVNNDDIAKYVPSVIEEDKKADKKSKKKGKKIWPLVLISDLTLLIIALATFSWSNVFQLDIFTKATTAVTEFKIFKFPLFGKLLGNVSAFGEWTIATLITLVFVATIIIAIVYKVKSDDFFENYKNGLKKAILPAFIMMLIYTVLVCTTYNPFQLVIYKALLNIGSGFNVITTAITAFVSGIFNVEFLYSINSVGPYLLSLVTDTSLYPLIGIIFQSMYGVAMLVAPTSIILMGTLAYLDIPYGKWLKHIWKFLLEMVVVLFIIFTIVMLV